MTSPSPIYVHGKAKRKAVPDLEGWEVEDVISWLKSEGLDQGICDKFTAKEVNGDVLLVLNTTNLKSEIEIESLHTRVTIIKVIDKLRSEYQRERKRAHLYNTSPTQPIVDISSSLMERLTHVIDLPADIPALRGYLDTPLREDEKIPLLNRHINAFVVQRGNPKALCSRDDLLQLFRPSEVEEADAMATLAQYAMSATVPHPDSTESAYHHFWDAHMAVIIDRLISEGYPIRDSCQNTDIVSLLPDYGYLFRRICVFRGEEKRLIFSGRHPKDELIDKLGGWYYDPAPYVLAYYAVGPNVTLAAITPTEVVDLVAFNLAISPDRIACLVRILKLCRLLKPLQEVIGYRTESEFVEIMKENGTIITIGITNVKKKYTDNNRISHVRHLRNVYELLERKKTPNVDTLFFAYDNDPKLGSVAYLSPRGINRPPRTAIEVTQAILCVLDALVVLHAEPDPLFHRDIRWPNVIKSAHHSDQWFLIDFDDASAVPTRAAKHMNPETHSPRVFIHGHLGEVDIWGVGKLIAVSNVEVRGVSADMKALAKRLVSDEPPTATEAIILIRSL